MQRKNYVHSYFIIHVLRSISEFQVRTMAGQIVSGSIEYLDIMERFLTERHLYEITKVSFYILDTSRPLEFCGIILCSVAMYLFQNGLTHFSQGIGIC